MSVITWSWSLLWFLRERLCLFWHKMISRNFERKSLIFLWLVAILKMISKIFSIVWFVQKEVSHCNYKLTTSHSKLSKNAIIPTFTAISLHFYPIFKAAFIKKFRSLQFKWTGKYPILLKMRANLSQNNLPYTFPVYLNWRGSQSVDEWLYKGAKVPTLVSN